MYPRGEKKPPPRLLAVTLAINDESDNKSCHDLSAFEDPVFVQPSYVKSERSRVRIVSKGTDVAAFTPEGASKTGES
ncbi:unnamed protein product [Menidia menidia]|uniref:(Atlantic silverside) hypothetical protein n=1 Tax=Menidia menidia TaxID=238744 RepID=A0A8S4BB63_9TELE|nr:unnamed protein product [Menidia menidia]